MGLDLSLLANKTRNVHVGTMFLLQRGHLFLLFGDLCRQRFLQCRDGSTRHHHHRGRRRRRRSRYETLFYICF